MRPRPVAVLAVVEAVVCGLVARHAPEDALPAALFLVPLAVGYQTVASSDERRLGVLTPSAALLMMLGAGIARGWAGVILVLLWTPFAMAWALMGGGLASLVRAICHAAAHGAARLARTAGSRRGGAGGESVPRLARWRVERDRGRTAVGRGEVWQQIIIRTPL